MTFKEYTESTLAECQPWLFERAAKLLQLHKHDYIMAVNVCGDEYVTVMYTELKFNLERKCKTYSISNFFLPK